MEKRRDILMVSLSQKEKNRIIIFFEIQIMFGVLSL
jgi:hypothetical protein